MGCHTWFYKKLDIPYEKVKENVIRITEETIKSSKDLLYNRKKNKVMLGYYPEWTKEYLKNLIALRKRQLRMIQKDLCKDAVCNKFYNKKLTTYIKGKGLFICSDNLPHDLIRIGTYPEDKLFSLEETLEFIEKHKDEIYYYSDNYLEKIEKFWEENPDGMIEFG